jgi:hypothetical protein
MRYGDAADARAPQLGDAPRHQLIAIALSSTKKTVHVEEDFDALEHAHNHERSLFVAAHLANQRKKLAQLTRCNRRTSVGLIGRRIENLAVVQLRYRRIVAELHSVEARIQPHQSQQNIFAILLIFRSHERE